MKITRTLILDDCAAPVSTQLAGVMPNEQLKAFDRHAENITTLCLSGLLTDRECVAARRRLLLAIRKIVENQTLRGDSTKTPRASRAMAVREGASAKFTEARPAPGAR